MDYPRIYACNLNSVSLMYIFTSLSVTYHLKYCSSKLRSVRVRVFFYLISLVILSFLSFYEMFGLGCQFLQKSLWALMGIAMVSIEFVGENHHIKNKEYF